MVFFRQDKSLKNLGQKLLEKILQEFSSLTLKEIALTWIVYDPPVPVNTGGALSFTEFWKYEVRGFSHQGSQLIDPGSLIQLFYLVAVYEWLEKGMISPSDELNRAIENMMIKGSHDATSLIVDMLTGTTSGPELSGGPLETWKQQRNIVNRYFQSLQWPELAEININQKTWGDEPYGREKLFWGKNGENQNLLTTDGTARLLHSIIGGVAVSSKTSQQMMNLMKYPSSQEQLSAIQFPDLPGSNPLDIWLKVGENQQVWSVATYLEIPQIQPCLWVVFLQKKPEVKYPEILPFLVQEIGQLIC